MPSVSIVIPTNRPPARLAACLEAIARLRFDLSEVEVLAVSNGAPVPAEPAIGRWPFRLVTDNLDEANISAAKNRAFDRASGEWIVLINDDTLAEPDFLTAHLAAHQQLDQPGIVLGRSVWKIHDAETLFDRMIARTSMIFFYDRLIPHQWYNFRHAWNLNVSIHRRYVDAVRFDERLKPVNAFEDLEWAYRLEQLHGVRVWYAPEALSIHDHRYTFDGYLQREGHLGRMAALLWRCHPDCFHAIYNARLDDAYLDYCRKYVEIEGRFEADVWARLSEIVGRRVSEPVAGDATQDELIQLLYDAHVPLKRLAFRRGLLAAINEARPSARAERVLAAT